MGPLSDLSDRFRDAHVAARQEQCLQLRSEGLLIRYSLGIIEIDWNGRSIVAPTSIYTAYVHILKSVTHAVFLASLLCDEFPSSSRVAHITDALRDVNAALAIFHDGAAPVSAFVPASERLRQITILSLTRDFLISLQKSKVTSMAREEYLLSVRPLMLADLRDASRATLNKLHETVQTAKRIIEQENPRAWESLTVIANVSHQSRARELGVQYFERLLNEVAGEGAQNERRLIIVENIFKPSDQRGALCAHEVDRKHAIFIFGEPSRLQWDVLADNGNLLDELLPHR